MEREVYLSPAEREALERLLAPDKRTGDLAADLVAAAQEAWERRKRNTIDGGAVIGALYRIKQSWREVSRESHIPLTTARRWATPPEEADVDPSNSNE